MIISEELHWLTRYSNKHDYLRLWEILLLTSCNVNCHVASAVNFCVWLCEFTTLWHYGGETCFRKRKLANKLKQTHRQFIKQWMTDSCFVCVIYCNIFLCIVLVEHSFVAALLSNFSVTHIYAWLSPHLKRIMFLTNLMEPSNSRPKIN